MQGTRNDVSDVSSEPRLGQNESDESIPSSLTALNAARAGGGQAIKHSAAGDDWCIETMLAASVGVHWAFRFHFEDE
jgi:hypothetical protein